MKVKIVRVNVGDTLDIEREAGKDWKPLFPIISKYNDASKTVQHFLTLVKE